MPDTNGNNHLLTFSANADESNARHSNLLFSCSIRDRFMSWVGMCALQGSRFAILHGDGPRPTFSIYQMKSDLKTTVKGVNLVGSQGNKQANQIHWSPQGKYLVLGGLKVWQFMVLMLFMLFLIHAS